MPRTMRVECAGAKDTSPLGWPGAEMMSRLKNDSAKLAMAARVRMETTLPIKWIDLPGWPTAGSDQAGHPS